jgi:hypothetical protein
LAVWRLPINLSEIRRKDFHNRWRAMRGVSVGTAILSEAVWAWRIAQDRQKDAEAREALESCEERCR